MPCFRAIVVLAAVVLAVSQETASASKLLETCAKLRRELDAKGLNGDVEKTLDFASNYLSHPATFSSNGRKLISAWKVALEYGQCSPSSLSYVQLMAGCSIGPMETFGRASNAYAQKCLTPEFVSQKVRKATSGTFTRGVDFISTDFIKKYHQENPEERAVNLQAGCCQTRKSTSAIVEAINQDYQKKGKNLADDYSMTELFAYMHTKLFKPCERHVSSVESFMDKLLSAATLYEGGSERLIASLDQEAQDAIFRYMYCTDVNKSKDFLFHVAQRADLLV